MTIYVQIYENGDIMSWGQDRLPGSIAIDAPSDWEKFSIAKYVIVNENVAIRDGWVDPVEEIVQSE